MTRRHLSLAGFAVAALSVAVLPWYALDDYVPNGWDATWWARIALFAALAGLALASADALPRARLVLAAVALAALSYAPASRRAAVLCRPGVGARRSCARPADRCASSRRTTAGSRA